MMGMDGNRRLFEKDVVKPQDLSKTMARFGHYFRPYWWLVAMTFFLILIILIACFTCLFSAL